jgi:ubiquinone/menaquinone biosynthesis C-methylase UbiE
MAKDQKQIWIDYSQVITVDSIKNHFSHPTSFQKEFNVLLTSIVKENDFKSAIEIGCEAGISLMLLNQYLEKSTFLDFDHTVLEKADQACKELNMKGTVMLNEDMFTIESVADETFDLSFNSGVIEHYTKEVRHKALASYARITKKGGYVIIAYPNHHTFPYRLSYLIGRAMGKKVWPWPKEYKFYSLQEEMEAAGLQYIRRETMDRETLFKQWVTKYKSTRKLFLFLDKFFHYEGYLTVCISKKI